MGSFRKTSSLIAVRNGPSSTSATSTGGLLPPAAFTRASYQFAFSGDGRRLGLVRWPTVGTADPRFGPGTEKSPPELTVWDAGTGKVVATVTLVQDTILPRVGLA